jgi:putative heme-binding domain-containing protein
MKRVLLCRFLVACTIAACLIAFSGVPPVAAQTLDEELRRTPAAELALQARQEGDALRGAVVFHQFYMACSKCHSVGDREASPLGPDLATLGKEVSDVSLVESLLLPSKVIRKGFESVTLVTTGGATYTGLLVERTSHRLTFRDAARAGELTTVPTADIAELAVNPLSLMPAGQVNQLASRQQFLDLIRYLIEVRDGGAARARELRPSPTLVAFTLPEYEQRIDHAALIGEWNAESLKRGEAIYQRVCSNCHGTRDRPGSLPTSLRFAEGKFKNGNDPLAMYQSLTRGFGLMAPQTWMVPSQKYDVIHYIRETYLRPHNPSQFRPLDEDYLARLPRGDTRGPEPSTIEPWSAMDYGPSLTHTYEVPGRLHNFAYKGIAVRLDPGAGGVSRGRHWVVFDTDTLRIAAAWSARDQGERFIDWRGIQFNGEHQVHPRVVGQVALANATGPGWANPVTGSFDDDQRVQGRDGRPYGPLPRAWAKFRGQYRHEQQVVLSYSVGSTDVLESPGLLMIEGSPGTPLFLRTLNIGPRDHDLVLQIAEHPTTTSAARAVDGAAGVAGADAAGHADGSESPTGSVVSFGPPAATDSIDAPLSTKVAFDGTTYLEVSEGSAFDLTEKDFTITARIKTTIGGTIFSLAQPGPRWTPDGQSFFVRDGHLAFDIGWVGVVTSETRIDDGQWHNVAVSWQRSRRWVRLYIDGRLDGEGPLAAKEKLPGSVARIGFTAPDFPQPASFFQGELAEVRFYQRRLEDLLRGFAEVEQADEEPLARWLIAEATGSQVVDATGHKHDAEVRREGPGSSAVVPLLAGMAPRDTPATWTTDKGRLRLRIPKGQETLRFTVWTAAQPRPDAEVGAAPASTVPLNPVIPDAERDLEALTRGGPAQWPQPLETQAAIGPDDGPLASDVLTAPENNPWLAQVRFTGLDFFQDGRIAVCSWDGDVWTVESVPDTAALRWRRIATGLFQPLGLKIVKDKIHVLCRDQLAVLHDRNGDGETDFYECLNNDHQVTEHFHEFAMGLQTDSAGNFYYAKSGRHALPAVVPHHGTLLRVSNDGSRTDILATGFRAANGVCLNPDSSFFVTDQEGFWNPKNRINRVVPGPSGKPKFYGNLYGYTDVTDPSDAAMEPPLCWITNAFDRSPAELLWVDSDRWGPLRGSLLNLSYGTGKVFLVPHERVNDAMQGGMIELPLPPFPTGVMRGRFHPDDHHLYLCGMFAWAGSATSPGGLYRLRATGKPLRIPVALHAARTRLTLTFTDPLDPAAIDARRVQIKTWSLKRTSNYGSDHYDERPLAIQGAALSDDRTTLTLDVPDLQPTWCMEIRYALRTATGEPIEGVIHNTIHELAD